jgi:hypothetical protein
MAIRHLLRGMPDQDSKIRSDTSGRSRQKLTNRCRLVWHCRLGQLSTPFIRPESDGTRFKVGNVDLLARGLAVLVFPGHPPPVLRAPIELWVLRVPIRF